jgi:asparagine synthetase B (glutamine-hydrolysing)
MYQVGRAQAPGKDDPCFEEEAAARQAAEKLSLEHSDVVFAVWELMDHDAPYTAYLYYQGETFKSVY